MFRFHATASQTRSSAGHPAAEKVSALFQRKGEAAADEVAELEVGLLTQCRQLDGAGGSFRTRLFVH